MRMLVVADKTAINDDVLMEWSEPSQNHFSLDFGIHWKVAGDQLTFAACISSGGTSFDQFRRLDITFFSWDAMQPRR